MSEQMIINVLILVNILILVFRVRRLEKSIKRLTGNVDNISYGNNTGGSYERK